MFDFASRLQIPEPHGDLLSGNKIFLTHLASGSEAASTFLIVVSDMITSTITSCRAYWLSRQAKTNLTIRQTPTGEVSSGNVAHDFTDFVKFIFEPCERHSTIPNAFARCLQAQAEPTCPTILSCDLTAKDHRYLASSREWKWATLSLALRDRL
jgi:hypothetical protein